MTKDKKAVKRSPPQAPMKSAQYDLFTTFLTNKEGAVSNAIEIWDGIPKYFLTSKQQEKLRTHEGLANPFEWGTAFRDDHARSKYNLLCSNRKTGLQSVFPVRH